MIAFTTASSLGVVAFANDNAMLRKDACSKVFCLQQGRLVWRGAKVSLEVFTKLSYIVLWQGMKVQISFQ